MPFRSTAVAVAALLTVCAKGATAAAAAPPAPMVTRPVRILIDGRTISAATRALTRRGVVYVDVASIVRSFSGLLTYDGSSATASVGNRVAIFTAGSALANLDGRIVPTGGRTFLLAREVYVPLAFFVTHVALGTVRISPSGSTALVTSRPIERLKR